MRRAHFEALRPVCPVCRSAGRTASTLVLAHITTETADGVVEGILNCPDPACQHEFPIVDGIPIIVPDVRQLVADQVLALQARRDLSPLLESLIGDCCGPTSAFEATRQQLSIYAWGHYADLDPVENAGRARGTNHFADLLAHARDMLGSAPNPPVIDIGCSVGRGAFELAAATGGLVLGVDLNFAMLRLASDALRSGVLTYARRRVGLVYERRAVPVRFVGADRVDFWACDALALPFAPSSFGSAFCMNLLDCVAAPRDLLAAVGRLLRAGGQAVFACPYDWSAGASRPEAWLGGHSQRSPAGGSSETLLRSLLTPGHHPQGVDELELTAERDDLPWTVRLHDRSAVEYRVHMVAARRRDS